MKGLFTNDKRSIFEAAIKRFCLALLPEADMHRWEPLALMSPSEIEGLTSTKIKEHFYGEHLSDKFRLSL